ncbi:metal ABC transporter substrate-binding protein [Sanguibacter suaedae]|uniref:Zinc ABC transporter substrate-binding protein n=1 Tax=Sanguibacter suaedae TaxID=2795737 RepID=A0A934I344_9MICO|nr:metal ABC transporter substrate-binding protein [Sanguibacter suaedae]MBI9114348.1 zinc ABC transporter substrate-binding protein [Sanguibacter suaedae]
MFAASSAHRPSRARRAALVTTASAVLALAVGGCATEPDDGRVQVLASFYPLQYVTEQVGGDLVTVESLTPPGAEPHDLELSPAHARKVADADLVVYLSDFQPAVDEAVAAQAPEHVVDAADAAALEDGREEGHEGETAEEHAEHADEDEHDHGSLDPHFWLDPTRLAAVSEDVVAELSAVDPANADAYAARGAELVAGLTDLDAEYSSALQQCEGSVLVTSHEAFGYLAERYGLEQVGISGIDPEADPSPARLREVSDVVRENDVSTIYFETLASSKVTDTLASDLGVGTAVLDPLEGLTDPESDYRSVMLSNLESLRTGLGCA